MQVYQKLKCVLYLHINSDTQSCILTFDSKLSTLKWQFFDLLLFFTTTTGKSSSFTIRSFSIIIFLKRTILSLILSKMILNKGGTSFFQWQSTPDRRKIERHIYTMQSQTHTLKNSYAHGKDSAKDSAN